MPTQPQVWLLTGISPSPSLGLSLLHALSSRGALVLATGRSLTTRLPSPPHNVTLFDLDVTSPLPQIQSTIAAALAVHGRIDVLVNNAGVSRLATLEEMDEDAMREVMEVNFWGAVKVTRAVLAAGMRERGEGTVVFVGAGMGWVGLPFLGGYSVSKAAVSMFAESLQKEITPLGLRSVIFEPGGFDSDLTVSREGGAPFAQPPQAEEYIDLFSKTFGSGGIPPSPGDVSRMADAIIDVVTGEGLAKGRPFPVRVVLGPDALDAVRQKCNEQLQLLDTWEDVSLSVMYEGRRETSRWLLDGCSMLNKS